MHKYKTAILTMAGAIVLAGTPARAASQYFDVDPGTAPIEGGAGNGAGYTLIGGILNIGSAWFNMAQPAVGMRQKIRLIGPANAKGLEAYTLQEVGRVFHEHLNTPVQEQEAGDELVQQNTIVIGTATNNPVIAQLIKDGFVKPESGLEGYSLTCGPHPQDSKSWLLAIVGADSRGALYGLRDLEHYELKNFTVLHGLALAKPFARRDYPRIQHRGHWVWGCNMPDKKAWMENMSRWKMNELIHWDNYPPKKAKEYVDFAHSRGIRVVWGFGWGWNPDWNFDLPKEFDWGLGGMMCGSSPSNRQFFRQAILRKIREDYVPTGCDGVYFQSFTEAKKCACKLCKDKSMGQLMLEFVNPIVADIKKEFPDLWVSCGIHANFGKYMELKDIDPRCNIYWENCPSGVSIRGADEDFGYINKTLPYGHGFSKTCPADPEWTEDSLQEWMRSNANRYALRGNINTYADYLGRLQSWADAMTKKPKAIRHGTTVADHSVFCRRTPFMHVALAEAMWNPTSDSLSTAQDIVAFLDANGGVPRFTGSDTPEAAAIAQHDAIGKKVTLMTRYSPQYTGGGDQALTDGKRAAEADHKDPAWQGYHRQNLDAVVELGKPMSINGISAGFLHEPRVGVYLPDSVEFAVTRDGKAYEVIKVVKRPAGTEGNRRAAYTVEGLDLYKVTGVRVRACFLKEWLFVDELLINPVAQE
jgi:hypothetical protein